METFERQEEDDNANNETRDRDDDDDEGLVECDSGHPFVQKGCAEGKSLVV